MRGIKGPLYPTSSQDIVDSIEIPFSKAGLISDTAPLKLVPLALYTSIEGPRLLTNLVKAWLNDLLVRSWAISLCTARIAKHENKHPFLLT